MTSAIIVAAGSSRRMGFNKLLAPLAGVPVLRRTLAAFEACADVSEIIVVAGDEVREAIEQWSVSKLARIVPGGEARHWQVSDFVFGVQLFFRFRELRGRSSAAQSCRTIRRRRLQLGN